MRVLIRAMAVAGLGGALLVTACSGGSTKPEATAAATTAATTAATKAPTTAASPAAATKRTLGATTFNDRGVGNATGKTEFAVSTENFAFAPSFIQGTPGSKVTLVVKNDSTTNHNLSLKDQSIDKNIAVGATERIEVSIPASGALLFICKFHANSGMNGELLAGTIEPQPIAASGGTGGGGGAAATPASGGSDYGY
jgi:plastocyanin